MIGDDATDLLDVATSVLEAHLPQGGRPAPGCDHCRGDGTCPDQEWAAGLVDGLGALAARR